MGGIVPIDGGPLHALIGIAFDVLIIAFLVRMLLGFFMMMVPISPSNRFMRFTDSLIDPLMDPIRKRIPSSSMGAVNLAYTIAFIFAWWGLRILAAIILIALPYGW